LGGRWRHQDASAAASIRRAGGSCGTSANEACILLGDKAGDKQGMLDNRAKAGRLWRGRPPGGRSTGAPSAEGRWANTSPAGCWCLRRLGLRKADGYLTRDSCIWPLMWAAAGGLCGGGLRPLLAVNP